jgi:hypothetical protein
VNAEGNLFVNNGNPQADVNCATATTGNTLERSGATCDPLAAGVFAIGFAPGATTDLANIQGCL